MAKVNGPLMSQTASGAFGKKMIFGNQRGTNVVRKLTAGRASATIPQQQSREKMKIINNLIKWAASNDQTYNGRGITDREAIIAITPKGTSWTAFCAHTMRGTSDATWTAKSAKIQADMDNSDRDDWPMATDSDGGPWPNSVVITALTDTANNQGSTWFQVIRWYEMLADMGINAPIDFNPPNNPG
jgi:hypothetical protein